MYIIIIHFFRTNYYTLVNTFEKQLYLLHNTLVIILVRIATRIFLENRQLGLCKVYFISCLDIGKLVLETRTTCLVHHFDLSESKFSSV